MKLTLFIVSIILGGPVFAESDFVSNHFIDRPYTEAAKKYKNAPWETPCGKEFSAYCKETGLKCECRQLNLASGPTFGRMLGFYIGNGSVLGYVDVSTVRGTFGLDKVLGTAKSFLGMSNRPRCMTLVRDTLDIIVYSLCGSLRKDFRLVWHYVRWSKLPEQLKLRQR